MQWTTSSQASVSHGVKMLVYSDAGIGKTMLIATLPRPALISAESGLLSLHPQNIARVFGANRPEIAYDIPVMQVTTLDQLKMAYAWFANPANRAREHFASVGLDSITEIAEVILTTAKIGAKDPRQAYGELLDQMVQIIRLFRDLPGFNVYMSAKMEPMKDGVSGAVKWSPMMPGSKLGPQIPYFFDEVFALRVGQTKEGQSYRYLQTQPDMQYTAKDRSGRLEPAERPELWYIIQKMLGG